MQIVATVLQIDSAYYQDALEILTGSKLLRASARAVKVHSQVPGVFDSAVILLNLLWKEYSSSNCFDALVQEVLDSNLALEVEIAVKALQVCFLVLANHHGRLWWLCCDCQ